MLTISVIIPVYNGESFINDTIESAINQDYKNLEIIIIDDGSTDKSIELIKKYANANSMIKVIYNERNLGLMRSLNRAARICDRDFFVILGQDDLIVKDHITQLVKHITNSTSLIYCNSILIDENNNMRGLLKSSILHSKIVKVRNYYPQLIRSNIVNIVGSMHNKEKFIKVGGFPEFDQFPNYGEWVYMIKMSSVGDFAFASDVNSLYRNHSNNLSKTLYSRSNALNYIKYIEKCRITFFDYFFKEMKLYHKVLLLLFFLKNQFDKVYYRISAIRLES